MFFISSKYFSNLRIFFNFLYVSAFEELDNLFFQLSQKIVSIYCLSL